MEQTKTALQQAIEKTEERVSYLRKAEYQEINALDNTPEGMLRDMKWKLINSLSDRRHELEDNLKLLKSALSVEQHQIEQAYIAKITYGYCQAHIEGAKNPCHIQCDHCKEYYAPLELQLATDYFNSKYGVEKEGV